MDEATWPACTDPQRMLEFLRGRASDRKLRLLACSYCRQVWHLLTDERARRAVEVGGVPAVMFRVGRSPGGATP